MFRPAIRSDFERVYPLLKQFNAHTTREEWQRLFLDYFHSGEARAGFLQEEGDEIIGYAGVIFSRRWIAGQEEKWANLSSWIIDPRYQGKGRVSYGFLKRVVAESARLADEEGYTVASFSSIPSIVRMLRGAGFELLDSHRVLIFPLSLGGSGKAKLYSGLGKFQNDLSESDKQVSRDHAGFNCLHVLLRSSQGDCYLIARRRQLRKLPFLQIHYLGNREVFLNVIHRVLPRVCVHYRVAGIALDQRYLAGERVKGSLKMELGYEQVYRSSQLGPEAVDTLYSELFVLDF